VDTTEIDIVLEHEIWNEYQLADGNVLRVKYVLKAVYTINGELDPNGTPIYGFEGQFVVRLKGKGSNKWQI